MEDTFELPSVDSDILSGQKNSQDFRDKWIELYAKYSTPDKNHEITRD